MSIIKATAGNYNTNFTNNVKTFENLPIAGSFQIIECMNAIHCDMDTKHEFSEIFDMLEVDYKISENENNDECIFILA